MLAVPKETRRRPQICWNWSYGLVLSITQELGTEPGLPLKAVMFLTTEPSLFPFTPFQRVSPSTLTSLFPHSTSRFNYIRQHNLSMCEGTSGRVTEKQNSSLRDHETEGCVQPQKMSHSEISTLKFSCGREAWVSLLSFMKPLHPSPCTSPGTGLVQGH